MHPTRIILHTRVSTCSLKFLHIVSLKLTVTSLRHDTNHNKCTILSLYMIRWGVPNKIHGSSWQVSPYVKSTTKPQVGHYTKHECHMGNKVCTNPTMVHCLSWYVQCRPFNPLFSIIQSFYFTSLHGYQLSKVKQK